MHAHIHYMTIQESKTFLISHFCHVLNIVHFLLGNSPASEFYMPTFWNTVCSIFIGGQSYLPTYEDGTDSVLKRWHIKFSRWGITQKKAYNKVKHIEEEGGGGDDDDDDESGGSSGGGGGSEVKVW